VNVSVLIRMKLVLESVAMGEPGTLTVRLEDEGRESQRMGLRSTWWGEHIWLDECEMPVEYGV
jgi:hypothetical protein